MGVGVVMPMRVRGSVCYVSMWVWPGVRWLAWLEVRTLMHDE